MQFPSPNGISAAPLVASCIAAARAAFFHAESPGGASASISLLKAVVSSSTRTNSSSFSCCADSPIAKYLILSSHPVSRPKVSYHSASEAPSAPISAAGGTTTRRRIAQRLITELAQVHVQVISSEVAESILNSIIFSFGSNSFNSFNPMERIAMSMSSSSDAPSEHFCLRKYFPASTKHFFGHTPRSPIQDYASLVCLPIRYRRQTQRVTAFLNVRQILKTCAIPYSSTYHPMAFTCFNMPGMRTGSPALIKTGFPDGVPSSV